MPGDGEIICRSRASSAFGQGLTALCGRSPDPSRIRAEICAKMKIILKNLLDNNRRNGIMIVKLIVSFINIKGGKCYAVSIGCFGRSKSYNGF